MRAWCRDEFAANGIAFVPVQANMGLSRRSGTIRGLHYQVAPALEEARRTVAATPNDVEANELLIDILAGVGLGYTAEQAYKARAEEYPKDPLAWYLYGRAAVHLEDSQAAYEKALSLNPRNARAVMGMAALERATGDLERAERDYKRALQMDSTLDEAWSAAAGVAVGIRR